MIRMRPCHHISPIATTYMASTRVISSPRRTKSIVLPWNKTLTASPSTSGAQTCNTTDTTVSPTAKPNLVEYGAKTAARRRNAGQNALGLAPGLAPSWTSVVSVVSVMAYLRFDNLLVDGIRFG